MQSAQRLDHQVRSDRCEFRRDRRGSGVGSYGEFLLEENIAGVEASIDAHGGHSRDGFTVRDGPLNWSGTAIFREQRGVEINVTQRREIEHPLRDDAAVADDDDGLRFDGGELAAEFVVGLDAVGLGDGEI